MKKSGLSAVDLVPLGERMRMISAFRGTAAALIIIGWLVVPSTRGDVSLHTTVIVVLAYLAGTLLVEAVWRRTNHTARFLFGVIAMSDSIFLAWSSYGSAGLDTPLRYLVLLQLITVCLLASFRTGLKLAAFNAWLLIGACYIQESGVANVLGGQTITFGDATFRAVGIEVAVYFLVTLVTTSFAAINERELRRRRYDLEELAQFALRLEEVSKPEEVAEVLLAGVAEIYGCEPSTVVRRDEEGLLRSLAARGLGDDADASDEIGPILYTPELDAPVVARAMSEDQTLLVRRTNKTKDSVLGRFAVGANVAIIPLRGDHGVVVGALVAEQPVGRGTRIERRVLTMMERFASHGSLALENAYLLAEVRALAITDPLTGLANRRHLDNTLDRATAQAAKGHGTVSLMMIDIDHFKRLNDTYGHQTGDDILKLVARALESDLRAGDLAARYGGEEFSVVMPGASGAEVRAAAERIRQSIMRLPHEIDVTISVGVAWAPDHGTTRLELTKAADAALYDAKESGRNRVELAPLSDLTTVRRAS
ncbi:MAG: diguanylate cyclase [Solirubrobacteraceae bacterium]|nr:diguanylate cyclase [Patulibacter sp.]